MLSSQSASVAHLSSEIWHVWAQTLVKISSFRGDTTQSKGQPPNTKETLEDLGRENLGGDIGRALELSSQSVRGCGRAAPGLVQADQRGHGRRRGLPQPRWRPAGFPTALL